MLKIARIILAIFFFCCITFLFLDFRNTDAQWYDWFRLTQIIPAIFAGAFVSIVVLLLLTLVFGRVYCSVICPLGVLQDGISSVSSLFMKKSQRKNRYSYHKGYPWFRYIAFTLFVIAMIIGAWCVGVRAWASLVEPYSAYGRIASSMLGPAYDYTNNILADISVSNDTTTFWHVEAQPYGGLVFYVGLCTLIVLLFTVCFAGRLWCNTVCPAGTLLGFFSRFSLLAPVINKSKCVGCKRCERDCKAQCIDIADKKVDYSRCVTCFNCIGRCKFDAMTYTLRTKTQETNEDEKK